MSRRPLKPHANPDRRDVPRWLFAAMAVADGLVVGIAASAFVGAGPKTSAAFLLGFAMALLAMVGLPSISIRLISRVGLLVSTAVLVRLGAQSGGLATGGQSILVWLVAAVTILVLTDRVQPMAAPVKLGDAASEGAARPGATVRHGAVVALAVVAIAVLFGPLLAPLVGEDSQTGDGPSLDEVDGGASPLRSSDSLDMTTRPNLTDEVVFTVETSFATFWRGETFDVWDGRRWTRSDPAMRVVANEDDLPVANEDLGAQGDNVIEQRITLETGYSEIIVAAPSPVAIDAPRLLQSRPDGTLVSAPMGKGATYTVTSRREPLSVERLLALDDRPTPDSILEQYAAPPQTTDRVRSLATEITASTTTRYAAIEAMQRWMGERVEYSLDAPLAPEGVDVVDNFLFDAEQGWCEQIASSLVVLARANGIPARLVSGYVPADQDSVTGVFTVRERDAHSWAEVWFPEVGWVPFDPTANVPLAGDDAAEPTILQWVLDHIVLIGLAGVAVVLVAGPVRAVIRGLRTRRADQPAGWAGLLDASLGSLGARVDRARGRSETAEAYATELARRYDDARLVFVGRLLDDGLYSGVAPQPDERLAAQAVVTELMDQPVPELVRADT